MYFCAYSINSTDNPRKKGGSYARPMTCSFGISFNTGIAVFNSIA